MKVTQVTVARLVNTGNYGNTRWELTASLDDGEAIGTCAAALQVIIAELARVERARRYPHDRDRRYQMWVEEDEWEEGARRETEHAARAAALAPGEPEST